MSTFATLRKGSARALPLAATLAVTLGVPSWAEDAISTVSYLCKDEKTIEAAYYQDRVELTLDDGREITLPQTPSGSGIRYADANETIIFWSKGDEAFVTEGAEEEMTYAGCRERKVE
jgi:membrane-bound inhibitor of C-type lysozyme